MANIHPERTDDKPVDLPLHPDHLADLRRSGLSDDQIRRCGFRSEADPKVITKLLNWTKPGKLGTCLVIPFVGPDGSPTTYARLKPGSPRSAGGKPVKYESPAGTANRAYFPPGTRAVLADPTVPLVITEGEKKAAKADQDGFPCVGLVGVYGFQKKRKKAPDGTADGPRELIPDLAAVAWIGRSVTIAYDSDAADNPQVRTAEGHLAEVLTAAGATVRVVRLPGRPDGAKVGLDDFLVARGPAAFADLLATATSVGAPELAGPNDDPANPHRLACGFLNDLSPDRPPCVLRYWRGEFIEWENGAFRIVPDEDVRARLVTRVRAEFVAENLAALAFMGDEDGEKEPPKVRPVTTKLIADVIQAVRSVTLLPSGVNHPAWIDGVAGPAPTALLPVKNGLLDLAAAVDGKPNCLLPATPSFFTFNAAPFGYDPLAPAPTKWLNFLTSVWPDDPTSIATLQEWFGYLLTPDTRQQKILFLLGPRRAGKGTIARILTELVGPGNVAGPTLNSLAQNFGLAPLLDKSVAIIDDARLSGRSDAAVVTERLLTISGEGTLSVDRKHRSAVTTKLSTRLVILSNELPRLGDASGALAGRVILLKFTRSWFDREDSKLFEALVPELPGILLWAIRGWRRLRDRGRFHQPASGAELLAELEDLSSPVKAFVRERCVVGPRESVPVEEVYAEWRRWCESAGKKEPGTSMTFGRDLRAAVPELSDRRPKQNGERWREYVGLRVRRAGDPDPDELVPGSAVPPLHPQGAAVATDCGEEVI